MSDDTCRSFHVFAEVTYQQVAALIAAANGKALDTGERCEVLALAISLRQQMRDTEAKVARLLGDMGADALVAR